MITIFVVISSVMTTPRVSMNFIIKLWNNAMNIRWKRNTFACTFRLNNLKALHSAELKSERIHRNYLGNCPTALSAKPELSDWQGLELEADEMQSQILNSSAFRMWETAQHENFVFATFSENKNNCALIWYQSDTDCSLFFVKILSWVLVFIRKWWKLNGREISSREHEKIWFSIHQQSKHGWPSRVILNNKFSKWNPPMIIFSLSHQIFGHPKWIFSFFSGYSKHIKVSFIISLISLIPCRLFSHPLLW